jgi:hypothetical protein
LPEVLIVPFPQSFDFYIFLAEQLHRISLLADDDEVRLLDRNSFFLGALHELGQALAVGGDVIDEQPASIPLNASVDPAPEEPIISREEQGDIKGFSDPSP